MGGGKGGSQTTTVQIPPWLQEAAKRNIARADQTATIGYTPYYGPDVAALTPMQEAAMANTNQAALSFGLAAPSDPMAGIPLPQTFSGGVLGYSSGSLYDQALAELQRRAPGQYAALRAPFIDPITGAMPTGVYGAPEPTQKRQPPPYGTLSNNTGGDTYTDRQQTKALLDALAGGGGGGGSNFKSSNLASKLPGGVNTKNPNSVLNTAAAALTSKPQKGPTAADKPKANPKR
jgi:hypothetical protein